MGLDAYVMPLWRFKAGDFTSPVEAALGVKPIIISPDSQPRPRPPWYLRFLAKVGIIEFTRSPDDLSPEERRTMALRQVDALKAELTEMTGTPIDWPDHGEVHYSQQFHDPSILKAFAAWYDHREAWPEFPAAPGLRYYKHPVWQLPKPAQRRFPLLAEHSLYSGYLLPLPFEGIHLVEPYKSWGDQEFFHDVASTQAMLDELAELLEFMATLPEVRDEEQGAVPVADARWYAQELQRMCLLSMEHRLPVIFYG